MSNQHPDFHKIILEQIGKRHSLGHKTGGSGHMGYVGWQIDEINSKQLENGNYEVIYQYSIYVETEFTVYGENDPMMDSYEYQMIVRDLEVLSDTYIQQLNTVEMELPTGLEVDHDDMFWYERLDQSRKKGFSTKEQEQAIHHFQSKMIFPEYLLTPAETFAPEPFNRTKYENYLKCLEPWIEFNDVQLFYCDHLLDPTRPGADFAIRHLKFLLSQSIPAINETMKKMEFDPDVHSLLEQLKKDIKKSEHDLRGKIVTFITSKYHKQHPQSAQKTFSIIEFLPYRDSEGNYLYKVTFKAVPASDQEEPFPNVWTFHYDWERKSISVRT